MRVESVFVKSVMAVEVNKMNHSKYSKIWNRNFNEPNNDLSTLRQSKLWKLKSKL